METTGIYKYIDKMGRFKIPRELLDSYNLKQNSSLIIYTIGKKIILEAKSHNCIFCNSEKNIHSLNDKYICNNCINNIKKLYVK